MRVSVLLDANGANTTAAAAVLMARRYVDLAGATAVVLAGTGPVGQRAARCWRGPARSCVWPRVGSIGPVPPVSKSGRRWLTPISCRMPRPPQTETAQAVAGCDIVFAAGAAGIELISPDVWREHVRAKVAIDLNAVPPVGLAGVKPSAAGVDRGGVICFGAIGVGGLKMKIHKAAVRRLFEANDRVLDAEEIFAIGCELEQAS